ncbi:MAG: LysR substrate-binding domain-containing protein [Pseudomonadota bacterium]
MKNLTLKQLRYFQALAEHRHFGRAAAACSISQPALSMQIKDLEADAGAPLVERGARQVHLTALGKAFADRARDILAAVDELQDLTRAAQGRLSGRLRLGVIPTVAPYLLPRMVASVSASHPGLELQVRETVTPRLLEGLGDGNLDAAVMALPVVQTWLATAPILAEHFVLLRPASDRGAPVPAPEKLRKMRLLLLEEGHCFRDQALAFCNFNTALPREGFDASSLSTLVQMVAAGIGVTLLPEMAIPVETRSATVDVAHFAPPEPRRTVGLVWRRKSPLGKELGRLAKGLSRDFGGGVELSP